MTAPAPDPAPAARVLMVARRRWRLARVDAHGHAAAAPPIDLADDDAGRPDYSVAAAALREQLQQSGRGEPALAVLLDGAQCLCAGIDTTELDRHARRRAMTFLLEEHLPVAAEDVVADFVELDNHRAVGVCTPYDELRRVIDALTGQAIAVHHVHPAPLLAAEWAIRMGARLDAVVVAERHDDAIDTGEPEIPSDTPQLDLVEFTGGWFAGWSWFAQDHDALIHRLGALAAGDRDVPLRVGVIGGDDSLDAAVRAVAGVEAAALEPHHGEANDPASRADTVDLDADAVFDEAATPAETAAARRAADVLSGEATPWIEFRRDRLAPPHPYAAYRAPLAALVAAAALLVVGTIVATQHRIAEYDQITRDLRAQQREVFREAVPDQRPPAAVKSRLLSVRRTLEGLGGKAGVDGRGAGPGDGPSLRQRSALVQLQHVLGGLPGDLRFRVLDLDIQPDRVRVEGEAQSHVEAERIAVALREAGHYDVDPPETRTIRGGGVSFVFTATPRDPAAGEPQALQPQAESDTPPEPAS